ncbi:MAG: TonB-dependent receptor [Pedobacter sp.]|nr:MAG: TonB-dependent receptor [Pedobacter sp.]
MTKKVTSLFWIFLLFVTIFSLNTFAIGGNINPDDPILQILKKIKAWTNKSNIEKVHLHLDKTHYNMGEHIWFKAIVTDFETLAPTTQSEVLYVELFNEKDTLSNQAIIRLNHGLGHGQFFLPDSLQEGNYRIRAYTQWMKNAGPEYFFSKSIKVLSPLAVQLNIQTNFQTESTGNTSTTKATFTAKNNLDHLITDLKVNYQILQHGKSLAKGNLTSDKEGKFSVLLPKDFNAQQASGQIILKFEHFNRAITQVIPLQVPNEVVDIQFFPESGHLISGLSNRVAFKATNSFGKGQQISGEIVDESGEVISSFESTHKGMGSFYLLPTAGKSYTAKIKPNASMSKTVSLPKVEKSGYLIQVTNANGLASGYPKTGNIQVRVLLSEDLMGQNLYLIAHQNGRESFVAEIPNQKAVSQVNLPIAEMGSGINTLTLLNKDFLPIAERLVFVHNPIDFMELKALNLKPHYQVREKVDLNFNTLMSQGLSEASFSVAVTSLLAYVPDSLNESHLYASLLLESDLKGLIEDPNYYFESQDDAHVKAIDHLLLTQGWRKLDWMSIAQNKSPNINFEVQKSLSISGNVSGKAKGNERYKVVLFTQNIGMGIDTLTSQNGDFIFNDLTFPDSTRFMIQARNAANKPVDGLKIFSEKLTGLQNFEKLDKRTNFSNWENIIEHRNLNELKYDLPASLRGTIGLKQVEIKKYQEAKPVVQSSSNLNGPGKADVVLTVKDFGISQKVKDILNAKAGSFMNANRSTIGGMSVTEPIIVFDGVPIEFDPINPERYLNLLDMTLEMVGSIEVLKSPIYTSMYGSRGGNGVILINSRSPLDMLDNSPQVSFIQNYLAKGFLIPKEFYSPNYSETKDTAFDNRTTVYWNPSIYTDEKGNFNFNYFNTDEKGLYRMVLEGINANGEMLRKVFHYQVK